MSEVKLLEQQTKQSERREFEKLPKESPRAYAAFKSYLDAGPERALRDVAQELGKSRALIERWSRRYDWPGRVAAYGAYVAEVERMAIERVAVEKAVEWAKLMEPVRREAWQEADAAIKMLREARERWEKSNRVPGFEAMARMLELAFKLKQFAVGYSEKQAPQHEDPTVRVEVSLALDKIYGESLPVTVESHLLRVEGPTEPDKPGADASSQSLLTSTATKEAL